MFSMNKYSGTVIVLLAGLLFSPTENSANAKSIQLRSTDPDIIVVEGANPADVTLEANSYTYGRKITVINKGSTAMDIIDNDTTSGPTTIATVAASESVTVVCTKALCDTASDWYTLSGGVDTASGTLSTTATGPFTSTQNVTVNYSKTGNSITITIPSIIAACTATSTTINITASLPSGFRPNTTIWSSSVKIRDNNTDVEPSGVLRIDSSGTVVIQKEGDGGNFNTSGGQCGSYGVSLSYNI